MVLTRLKDVMRDKSVRQEDIASKTGLSIETIKNARRGKSVSLSTATTIAKFLHMSTGDLA